MNKLYLFIAAALLIPNFILSQTGTEIVDYKKFFDNYNVTGSFILHDLKNNKKIVYNPERCDSGYYPASTFKIPHALIALETGIAKDKDFTLQWDKKERWVKNWNRDHTLESAIKFSVVWYFVEIAKLIGKPVLKEWLEKIEYGNEDVSGDQPFWLQGNLRITPNQQMDFIKRFYTEELPFSKGNIGIVKNAILIDEGDNYELHAKTGWADTDNINLGWLVGYLEKGDDVFLFVTNVESGIDNKKFADSRLAISKSILAEYTGISFSEN